MKKQHFIFLDGLRGFAALCIVLLHTSEIFNLPLHPGHAYLAVDFFFCLSGFVISYAYDDRLKNRMTMPDFCVRRLIRLYPMILIGIFLGLIATVLHQHLHGKHEAVRDELAFIATLFLIPIGILVHDQAYPLNNPIWSLFFELFANLVFAIQQRFFRLRRHVAAMLLCLFATALIALTLHSHSIEFIGFNGKKSFLGGFIRVFYPFFSGVLIYRYALFQNRYQLRPPLILCLLLFVLLTPMFQHSWVYDSVSIIVVFPLIVAFGAKSRDIHIWSASLWKISGRLSFPVYIIHQPILRVFHAISVKSDFIKSPLLFASLGFLTCLILAHTLVTLYDEPLRRLLSTKWKHRASPLSAASTLPA